jgi:hypothetical protein
MIRTAILAALALVCVTLFSSHADARQRHRTASCVETGTLMNPVCGTVQAGSGGFLTGVRSIKVTMHREKFAKSAKKSRNGDSRFETYGTPTTSWADTTLVSQARAHVAAQIVAHPSGCPRTAFCGCGAAVRVFGRAVRELWLAANWFKFPRAAPAAGMVAVRRHHVMVLEADLGGGVWSVFDANSGKHLTRIHSRSIAGFTIVNPRGASS